jgi:hypothetical protein
MGMAFLTFDELKTLITQTEECLNSRTLVSLSNDPDDPSALIPGHFLIGRLITAFPEPKLRNIKISLLSSWKHLQHFWRW